MGVELNIAGLTIFNQEKCPIPSTFVGEICRADPQFSEIQSIKGAPLRVFLHWAMGAMGSARPALNKCVNSLETLGALLPWSIRSQEMGKVGFLTIQAGGSQSWISGGGKDG